MNTKNSMLTGKIIALPLAVILASPALGSNFDQEEKTEGIRESRPEVTEEPINSSNDTPKSSLLEAIERAGGFRRLIPRKNELPVPPRVPTDGSMLATSSGDQPISANKTRARTALGR